MTRKQNCLYLALYFYRNETGVGYYDLKALKTAEGPEIKSHLFGSSLPVKMMKARGSLFKEASLYSIVSFSRHLNVVNMLIEITPLISSISLKMIPENKFIRERIQFVTETLLNTYQFMFQDSMYRTKISLYYYRIFDASLGYKILEDGVISDSAIDTWRLGYFWSPVRFVNYCHSSDDPFQRFEKDELLEVRRKSYAYLMSADHNLILILYNKVNRKIPSKG